MSLAAPLLAQPRPSHPWLSFLITPHQHEKRDRFLSAVEMTEFICCHSDLGRMRKKQQNGNVNGKREQKARPSRARLSHQKINIQPRKCNEQLGDINFLFMKGTLDDVLLSSRQFTARIKIDCERKNREMETASDESALVSA